MTRGRKPYTEEEKLAALERRRELMRERNKEKYHDSENEKFRKRAIEASAKSRRKRDEERKIINEEKECQEKLYWYYMKCINEQLI
jgi:hypothetical protein